MKSIVVIGAGREGKGYLGNVFTEGGWDVTLIDTDPEVIRALEGGSYEVMEYRAEDERLRVVSGYRAYRADDPDEGRTQAILYADVISLCLYPADIPDALAALTPLLGQRASRNPGQKLSIFPCTNEGGLIPGMQRQLRDGLNDAAREWYDAQVALKDTIVRRPVGAESSSSLHLEAGVVCPMLVDDGIYADLTGVPWMERCKEDLAQLKNLKVHTINTAHAASAYAGYLKGYATIDEACADPEVEAIRDAVLDEAVPVLAKKYGVSEKSLWAFAVFPATKHPFNDPITRVAFDPIRKLSRHDRLTANACLCMEYGVDPKNLLQSIANGMAYDAPQDPNAQLIQQWISQTGIAAATARVTGLPEEHEVVRRVAGLWQTLKQHRKE